MRSPWDDNRYPDMKMVVSSHCALASGDQSMNDSGIRERELAPLRNIRDNYEKIVIAGDTDYPVTQDGIKIVKMTDFLLDG